MGSVLTGDNAAYPHLTISLWGRRVDPALPGGLNKTPLKEGQSVMVDLGGNFNGYMGDMSRVFSVGKLSDEAYTAHQVCLDIQEAVSSMAQPGVVCEDLYNAAINIVTKAGLPTNLWVSVNKPNSLATVSAWKSTRPLYLLPV